MMKKNRKLMAWLLSFAMIVGCFANVGVVKAEEGVTHKIIYKDDKDGKNDASMPEDAVESYTEGTVIVLTKPKDKDGYVFEGWYTANGIKVESVGKPGDTTDITLYAKWMTKYTVTIDRKNGSEVETQEIVENGKVKKPDNPSKANCNFGGWYTDESFENEYNFDKAVTGNITLFAKWTCTVTFDSKGGTAVGDQEIVENRKVKKPDNPSKANCNFGGWYKDESCTNPYDFQNETVTGKMTLYAKWITKYTVTIDRKNGSEVETQEIVENGKVKKPDNPSKANCNFGGWYTDESFENEYNFDKAVTGNITLFAKWTCTVTIDRKNGSEVETQEIVENGKVKKPDNPSKANCNFGGWYTDESFENKYDFDKAVIGNITLYAKWTCTVTIDKKNGSEVETQEIVENGKVTEPENPTKQYYTFDGWYTDNDCTNKYDFNKQVDGSLTLYAKWKENEVNLILKDGDNQKTLSFAQKDGVSADKLKEYTPAGQTGKIFLGWFEETNGRQTQYTEIKPDNITGTNGEFVLTAKWANITIPDKEIFAAKGKTGNPIRVSSKNITDNYSISYQWKKNGQDISNETGDSIPLNTNTVGTSEYSCVVKVKLGDFESTGTTGTEKVTVYNGNISITLNKSTTLKSIFGTNRKVTSMTSASKKYLTVNAKKGTLKVIKYNKKKNKKKKNQEVIVTINIDGQKFDVTVTIKLPKPKITKKKGKLKKYASGYFRTFVLSYKNISKDATKVVSKMSKKKKGKFAKGPNILNKLKGTTVSVKKGQIRRIKIVVYYGKDESPISNIVTLKG